MYKINANFCCTDGASGRYVLSQHEHFQIAPMHWYLLIRFVVWFVAYIFPFLVYPQVSTLIITIVIVYFPGYVSR
jgi:hypothetical protein